MENEILTQPIKLFILPLSYLQRLLPWVTPGCCEDNKEFRVCVVTRISSAQLTSTELVSSSEQLQRRSVHLYISNSLLLLLRVYSFPAWRRWVSGRKSVYATRSIGERSGRGGRGPHLETSGLGLEGGVEVEWRSAGLLSLLTRDGGGLLMIVFIARSGNSGDIRQRK